MILKLPALFFLLATQLCGCFRSLPPPTLRETTLPPSASYERVCSNGLRRADVTFHGGSKLSGIVQCTDSETVIVLFNSFNIRVRTITISPDGKLRDEISYLCTNDDKAEKLLSELHAALHATPTSKADTAPYLTISARE